MSWLDELLSASSEAETPLDWIYWAGISTIAAVIAPNVYLNRGGIYKLSPNVFVLLIGESGLGKGFPIAVSKRLLEIVDCTRVISGSNTIASILQRLGTTVQDAKTHAPKFKDSRAVIISGEFANILQDDKRALPILTELYDTHFMGSWTNSTKNSGVDKLEKVNITLFGGSTQEHFTNVVPESDVKGGLVGRILTVYQEERSKINPLDDTDAGNDFPFDGLAVYLHELSKVTGTFKFASDARHYWKEWYHVIRAKKVHDPTGAVNRLPDNVLKVAMCISMARDTELILERQDLEESIDRCMTLTIDSKRLTGGKGKSALGEGTHLVVQTLFHDPKHEIKKSKLLQMHYGQFDTYELDKIISTMENAGLVTTRFEGTQLVLTMPDAAIASIKTFMTRGS